MMDAVLSVRGLCKTYPAFALQDVTFDLLPGRIMGFIGRNGAGKTTTLKSLLRLIHPDSGQVSMFGLDYETHEYRIRQRIGYAGGTVGYFPKKRIRDLVSVTSSFYEKWDQTAFDRYAARFDLDITKTPAQLSDGMRVKLNLALALSHGAELLILDEPTSGLDPVSREELLEIFLRVAEEGAAILFSTHIISDLERCADDITYIRQGRILTSCPMDEFAGRYRLASGAPAGEAQAAVLGTCRTRQGETHLIRAADAPLFAGVELTCPGPEEIMIHLERGAEE